jgi:hypothetical protein
MSGYLDFILKKDNDKYALEIDRGNKKWSLQKLVHSKSKGYKPIWVRWCVPVKMDIPEIVYLINLTNTRTQNAQV